MEKPQTNSVREIVQNIRQHLPQQAFAPDPIRLAHAVSHLLIIALCYAVIRCTDSLVVWSVCTLMIGHSLACVAFVAHDLSHGSIIRSPIVRYVCELVLWSLNLVPPTLWIALHNRLHHSKANEWGDPDRYFLRSELREVGIVGVGRRFYAAVLCPNRFWKRWPVAPYWCGFLIYVGRHLTAVFLFRSPRPWFVAAKPAYLRKDVLLIGGECFISVGFQIAIYYAVGCSFYRWIFASPAALACTSAIGTAYIWTNHFIRPFNAHYHPLLSSTSVRVPAVCDWLHSHFSYHAEHHLFPTLRSTFYPEVGNALSQTYPDLYQRLEFREAWRILLSSDAAADAASASVSSAATAFEISVAGADVGNPYQSS